jgi:hypothetical protein
MKYAYKNGKIIKAFENIELLCAICPQFREDFPIFLENGVITKIGKDDYRWNFSKTSLGEYFKYIAVSEHLSLVFIEETFKMKTGSLKHLISTNGIIWKQENPQKKSKDFEKILALITQDSTIDTR